MSAARRPVYLAAAATVVPAVLYASRALPSSRAIAVWIVLLAAIAFAELVRALRAADETNALATLRFEEALCPSEAENLRPAELERMEREIVLGAVAEVWARHGLLPRLRAAAAARLSMKHGIDFERSPHAARGLLGEDVWDLVRPDRPEPADAAVPGIPPAQIETLLARLESL